MPSSDEEASGSRRPRRSSYFPANLDDTPDYERRYGDFTTIDWVKDAKRERTRLSALDRQQRGGSLNSRLLLLYDSLQPILVILIVGSLIGVTASLINVTTEWLSDLKIGYCSTGWWLNQKFCCWAIEDTEGTCPLWYEWSYAWNFSRDVFFINWISFIIFAALFAAIAGVLVKSYAPYAAGSGISEIKTILSGFVIRGFLGAWTLIIKSMGLALSVGSGLSVGKEGPSVHVACCAGNVVSRFFSKYRHSKARKREILTAASAAGVAVAFGSPIGGVLFALEEMIGDFSMLTMWRSFACALVATLTIQAINPFRTGKLVMFQVTYERNWHFFEIFWFIFMGVCGGLYGALLIKLNLKVNKFRKAYLANWGIQEAVVLASLTAFVGYSNIFVRLDMTELMSILFKECEEGDFVGLCQHTEASHIIVLLLHATFLRLCFTIVSFGCKVPAGIFVPSMAIGACFGRMLGVILQSLHRHSPDLWMFSGCTADVQCITPGTYAFLGAAASLCGATKMTVSVVVIMFELTGALRYILPTMIVVLVTKAVGDLFYEGGIADQLIHLNGLPFLDKEDQSFGVDVSTVMTQGITVVTSDTASMRLSSLEATLTDTLYKGFPLVNNLTDLFIDGYVMRIDIMIVLDGARQASPNLDPRTICVFGPEGEVVEEEHETYIYFSSIVDKTPITISPSTPLETAMDYFKLLGPRVILVERRGCLVGQLTRKDAVKAAHRIHVHGGGDSQSTRTPPPHWGAEPYVQLDDLPEPSQDTTRWRIGGIPSPDADGDIPLTERRTALADEEEDDEEEGGFSRW